MENSDEQRLIDYQRKISNILESFTDGFFEVDEFWVVTYWNKAAERILMMPRAEIIGKNLWQAYPEAMDLKFYPEYHRAVADNVSVRFEEYYEQNQLWIEVAAFPSGRGLSVYFKDITERVNQVKAIEAQNQKLKEIYWIQSHKVRSPLARILGLIELMENQDMDRLEQKEVISYLKTAAKELDEVLEEIVQKT